MGFNDIYSFVIFLASALMLYMAIYFFRKKKYSVDITGSFYLIAVSTYAFGYACVLISTNLQEMIFWDKISKMGLIYLTTLWLLLVIRYSKNEMLNRNWVYSLLFIEPLFTSIICFTNEYHHLFYQQTFITHILNFPILGFTAGFGYHIFVFVEYIYFVLGVVLFLFTYKRSVPVIRRQIIILILGALLPIIFEMGYDLGFCWHLRLTPVGFTISGIIYLWGILRYNLLQLNPIAFEKIFESLSDGVVILDTENNIANFNDSAKNIIKELGNQNQGNRKTDTVFANYPFLLEKLNDPKNIDYHSLIFSTNDVEYYNLTISSIHDKLNEKLGTMLTFNDITENKLQQERLMAVAEQLSKQSELKDKLFMIVSHDIRDPMALLVNLTEILEEEKANLSSDSAEIVESLTEHVRNTYHMVENLLEWFRSQKGGMNLNLMVWNLSTIVKDTASILMAKTKMKNITLEEDIDDKIIVYADREAMELIIRNLISNAIKFTKRGGCVCIKAERSNDMVTVSVSDNGVGIDALRAQLLFNESQISPTVGTEGEKSTGLGLLICKEFVEQNGGEIWFDSTVGEGSTFSFTVPIGTINAIAKYED